MLRSVFHAWMLVLLTGLSVRADLTLRYTTEVKAASALPQPANIPKERFVRIKGDRTQSTSGTLTVIMDNAGGEITLLNPATKQYARIPMTEFAAVFQKAIPMPAAAQQTLQSMKFDIENNKTGQMGMVAGFRAEERLTTMAISMNLPGAANPSGPLSSGPTMRLELHTWVASPDELNRIPLLREYAASVERAARVFDTSDQIEKMFSQIPGLGEKLRAATAEMSKNPGSLTVKTTEAVYVPMFAQLGGAEANAPLMELRTDLAQISTDTIDDSFFAVPPDYQPAPSEEMFKALAPAPVPPPPPAPSAAVRPGRSGIGGPVVIRRQDLEYTEEARKAKISGAVLLSVVVDTEGTARNVKVVRSLDPGLDQKAIEAVSRWKFRPGQKDGRPVNVRATIAVNFRLVDRPPLQ